MISASNLNFYESLGSETGQYGLGGRISPVLMPKINRKVFEDVTRDQAVTGLTEYYCFYVKNEHASEALTEPHIYIKTLTPSPSSHCELAIGFSPNGVSEPVTANKTTKPNVTFSRANQASALSLPADLKSGEFKSLWLSRTIAPRAEGIVSDTVEFVVVGDIQADTSAGTDYTYPALTSPGVSSIGQTFANGIVTSASAAGRLYWTVDVTATAPTETQIKAGQTATGAPATRSGSAPVTRKGVQTIIIQELTAGASYYVHFLHDDGFGESTDVVTSALFSTLPLS